MTLSRAYVTFSQRIISKTFLKSINLVKNSENKYEMISFSKIAVPVNPLRFFLTFLDLGYRRSHGESIGTYAEFF